VAAVVAYSSPWVPPEWVAAHGLRPERVIPPRAEGFWSGIAGMCPFAAAFACHAARTDRVGGVVFATSCDQMRRAAELCSLRAGREVFLLNVPFTRGDSARGLYADELRRLGEWLVRLGGRSPSEADLVEAMRRHMRERDRRSRRPVTPRAGRVSGGRRVRLALLGGPRLREDLDLPERLAAIGADIVLDATETGERCWPARFSEDRSGEDPFGALVDAYFDGLREPFARPNESLHAWLAEQIERRSVEGVLLCRFTWCDVWAAEAERLRQSLPVPLLELDGGGPGGGASSAGRIRAFLEMLA